MILLAVRSGGENKLDGNEEHLEHYCIFLWLVVPLILRDLLISVDLMHTYYPTIDKLKFLKIIRATNTSSFIQIRFHTHLFFSGYGNSKGQPLHS